MPLAALHVAAIFFVALGAIALWRGGRAPWRSGVRRGLLALWLVIGASLPLAYNRAPDPLEGRYEITGLVCAGLLSLGFVATARSRGLERARLGWTLGLALCCAVAVAELVTNRHLWVPDIYAWVASRTIVAGPFRNPNDFAIAVSFMISGALGYRHALPVAARARRLAVAALVALACVIVVLTESRGGLMALVAVLGIHAVTALRTRRAGRHTATHRAASHRPGRSRLLVAGAAVAGVVALVAAFTVPALAARNPLARVAASLTAEGTARSDHLRIDLVAAAWRYALRSDGLGTGAASFEPLLAADPAPGVSVRTWLHNSFVELFLQYGVLPSAALALLLLGLIVALARSAHPSSASPGSASPGSASPDSASPSSASPDSVSPESASLGSTARLPRAEGLAALATFVALGLVASTVIDAALWWLMLAQAVASTAAWSHAASATAVAPPGAEAPRESESSQTPGTPTERSRARRLAAPVSGS